MTGFFEEWFGIHAGREILLGTPPRYSRDFIEKPEQLNAYVQQQTSNHNPAYMSVQPFSARDQPFGLEKLFFDFDCKEDLSKAWKDALAFATSLKQYYDVEPFIAFSGFKGYHVYVFLTRTVTFPTWRIEFVKNVYETLQRKLLRGLNLETLDAGVIGDIKRLARVPYSIHEKTGKQCAPLSFTHQFIEPCTLDAYREHGLDTRLLESVCKELKAQERWEKVRAKIRSKRSVKFEKGKVRPCIEKALSLPLHGDKGHMMRLGIAAEFLNKGYSVDQVVDLFRGQTDFDRDTSHKKVVDVKERQYKPFKCKTIRELGFCLGESCQKERKT